MPKSTERTEYAIGYPGGETGFESGDLVEMTAELADVRMFVDPDAKIMRRTVTTTDWEVA